MDRDDFIIAVFLIVCEQYQAIQKQYRIRRGGFAPTLTDEEVITTESCGEYFKLGCDKDLYAYFRMHYLHFFPKLTDRSTFVRQAANLWQVKPAIQKRLVIVSGQMNDPVQVIDTLPLPVCVLTRAARDHCFKGEADFGYCAAKDLHYYGFKLGLRISRLAMITHYPLLAVRPHDLQSLDTLLEGLEGVVPADKGFIDEYRQSRLWEQHGIRVVTPVRKNMQNSHLPEYLLQTDQKVCRNRRLAFDRTLWCRSNSCSRSLAFSTPFDPQDFGAYRLYFLEFNVPPPTA